MIGTIKDTINTDSNINDYAKFYNVNPANNGTVSIKVTKIGSYNYIAGFSITEQTGVVAGVAAPIDSTETIETALKQVYQGETIIEMGTNAVTVYPNPFVGSFKVLVNNKSAGAYVLRLSATSGQIVFYKKINKPQGTFTETININNLIAGTYILEIISVPTGNKTVHKVIKN